MNKSPHYGSEYYITLSLQKELFFRNITKHDVTGLGPAFSKRVFDAGNIFYINPMNYALTARLASWPQKHSAHSHFFPCCSQGAFSFKQVNIWNTTELVNVTSLPPTNQNEERGRMYSINTSGTLLAAFFSYMVYLTHPGAILFKVSQFTCRELLPMPWHNFFPSFKLAF